MKVKVSRVFLLLITISFPSTAKVPFDTCIVDFCYFYNDTKTNWAEARKNCRNRNAYLAEAKKENENDVLVEQCMSRNCGGALKGIWLGGYDGDTEGVWKWNHSGDTIDLVNNGGVFTNWPSDEPDNTPHMNSGEDQDCLYMLDVGTWRSTWCSEIKPSICQAANPCSVVDCHKGKCSGVSGVAVCTCEDGYTGNYCDQTCSATTYGPGCSRSCTCMFPNAKDCDHVTGACTCKQGWTGINCELDEDECAIRPDACGANSVCRNTRGGYDCQCNQGWTGSNCELDINECAIRSDACGANSVCRNTQGGYDCLCKDGFYRPNPGEGCRAVEADPTLGDSDPDPLPSTPPCLGGRCSGASCVNASCDFCEPDPCDGGSCLSQPSKKFDGEGQFSFTCKCDDGYAGPYCKLSDDPCKTDLGRCKNGGTCMVIIKPGENDWICRCPWKPYIGQPKDCSTDGEKGVDITYPISDVAMKAVISIPIFAVFIAIAAFAVYECIDIGELPDIELESVSGSHLSITSETGRALYEEESSDRDLVKKSSRDVSKRGKSRKIRKDSSSSKRKESRSNLVKGKGIGKNTKVESLENTFDDKGGRHQHSKNSLVPSTSAQSNDDAKKTRSDIGKDYLELKEMKTLKGLDSESETTLYIFELKEPDRISASSYKTAKSETSIFKFV